MHAMMRCQTSDELIILRSESARFWNPPYGDDRGNHRDVHVVDEVRVRHLAQQVEATHLPIVCRFVITLVEGGDAQGVPGE